MEISLKEAIASMLPKSNIFSTDLTLAFSPYWYWAYKAFELNVIQFTNDNHLNIMVYYTTYCTTCVLCFMLYDTY